METAIAAGLGMLAFGLLPGRLPQRPNIVVIRTDDQDFASMEARRPDNGQRVMQRVHALLAERGATFRRSFASVALCTPSRAAFLSGQYAHNNHVYGNDPPWGGYNRFDHANALPVWLTAAGYYSVHIGKYMNGYDGQSIPAGWEEWFSVPGGHYFNYSMNENGTMVHYGSAAADYNTDVMTRKAVEFILERRSGSRPFFLLVDYLAPHVGGIGEGVPIPASRHAGLMETFDPVWPPSFDEADMSDKPVPLQALPRFDAAAIAGVTEAMRRRLETLLAVDEGVGRIVAALRRVGSLDRTFIVFTSDNGYQLGEHRIPGGKDLPYEESIRVPLIVRGPAVAPGIEIDEVVGNIDLAPTILGWTGAAAGHGMDGVPLQALLAGQSIPWDRDFLVTNYHYTLLHPQLRRPWVGIRNADFLFVEYDGDANGVLEDLEIYSMGPLGCPPTLDPYQLESRHAGGCPARRIRALARRLEPLGSCSGATCW